MTSFSTRWPLASIVLGRLDTLDPFPKFVYGHVLVSTSPEEQKSPKVTETLSSALDFPVVWLRLLFLSRKSCTGSSTDIFLLVLHMIELLEYIHSLWCVERMGSMILTLHTHYLNTLYTVKVFFREKVTYKSWHKKWLLYVYNLVHNSQHSNMRNMKKQGTPPKHPKVCNLSILCYHMDVMPGTKFKRG